MEEVRLRHLVWAHDARRTFSAQEVVPVPCAYKRVYCSILCIYADRLL